MTIRNGEYDILFISEGTYPYIRGGVSSWIHQIINGLPEFKFGVVFLGSQKSDYNEIKYELPENLTYFYKDYLFDEEDFPDKKYINEFKEFEQIKNLHHFFHNSNEGIPDEIKNINFFEKVATLKNFLYSYSSFKFIEENYLKNTPESPFIDYFWSVRNMHIPIWKIIKAVKNIKQPKIIHSPSTGYAGFLAALLKINFHQPFILTEHGIYIRERKIDMLNASWIVNNTTIFQKKLGELAYAKNMWIKFFEGIGKITYEMSNEIISLFEGAKKAQIKYGANPKKCRVIPNGVNVEKLKKTRKTNMPKVVTLIGRVVAIKDIKTFIKAMKIAIDKMPELEGWIVGPTDEDEVYAKECFDLVELLGIKNKVKFLGFQNILDIFPKTGLLTLTSISEGMPLTIIEGFAAGVPCVATDVGSCRELIEGGSEEDKQIGKAGEVTQIANPSEIAENYIKILSNESLYREYSNNAIKRVETYYTQEYFLNEYKKIYLQYLEK